MSREHSIGALKPRLTQRGSLCWRSHLINGPHNSQDKPAGQTVMLGEKKKKDREETKWILTFPYLDAKVPVSKE